MKSLTQDGQSLLAQNKRSCELFLYGQNAQYISSLENRLAGMTVELITGEMEIQPLSAETEEKRLKLVMTNNILGIVLELSSDAVEGLSFRAKVREDERKQAIPILFILSESLWSDFEFLGQIIRDPYSFAIPANVDFRTFFAKLTHCVDFGLLHVVKELFDYNKKQAYHLQQTMLPPWVYFGKNYEFSMYYLPHNVIGGDLVEWFPLDEHRVLFIFGDISGHETDSALAMSSVHAFLSNLLGPDIEKARRPCLLANEIHDYLFRHFGGKVYLSALIAYFDFQSNYLCYLNAGYENLICCNSLTGKIDLLNPGKVGKIALGWQNGTVYIEDDSMEYWFSDYSVFMFFSDGLTDLAKDPDGFTYMDSDLLCDLFSGLVMKTHEEENSIAIPFRCYHLLQQHGYLYPQDDLTMGIIRKSLNAEKDFTFTCRVPADKKAVDGICEKVSAFVAEYYHDERLSVNTELLLEEYLVNVIMHGLDDYEKLYDFIAIELHAYDDRLQLMIWDHGKEWDGGLMQKAVAEDVLDRLNESMRESGRGLPIISTIASQGSRKRFSGLNETIFIIPKSTETGRDVQ